MERCPIAVIILTLNEELSLPYALDSVIQWAEQVFVLDSFSTDSTVEIAKSKNAKVYQKPFISYTDQRNWALDNLPLNYEWVFFLDADEYLSEELKEEISGILNVVQDDVSGFYTKMRYDFLGKWLKHGDIYNSLIRMIRKGRASYVKTGGCREKVIVKGKVLKLNSYIVHDDKKPLVNWSVKQSRRILLDAQERLESDKTRKTSLPNNPTTATLEGSKSAWLRNSVLLKLPGPGRPFAQFFYRYVLRLGFLDGWQGFIYHFLFQFWYPLMVEAMYIELKQRSQFNKDTE